MEGRMGVVDDGGYGDSKELQSDSYTTYKMV